MIANLLADAALKTIFRAKGNFARGLDAGHTDVNGVGIAPFLDDRPAAATISADFELSWAWRELPPQQRDEKARMERANFPILLSLLERTRIPVTWATVGHMFLPSCSRGEDGRAHPHMPRPLENDRWTGDWYAHDPCDNAAASPLWYSPDLIQQLLGGSVRHEIASHSFSHIDFSDRCSTSELVEAELRACIAAMAPYGVRPRTLVYPFNKMGHHHLGVLGGLGVTAVRHRDPRVRLSYPERTASGVYKVYETLNLRKAAYYDYPTKAAMFLDEAAKRRSAFHIWFHPSADTDVFQDVFRVVVEHMAALRDAGRLWTPTMEQLVAYCEARAAVQLQVTRTGTGVTIAIDGSRFDSDRYGETDLTLLVQPGNGLPAVPVTVPAKTACLQVTF